MVTQSWILDSGHPGASIPVLNNPFCKEVFPDIQPKLTLVQLEATVLNRVLFLRPLVVVCLGASILKKNVRPGREFQSTQNC